MKCVRHTQTQCVWHNKKCYNRHTFSHGVYIATFLVCQTHFIFYSVELFTVTATKPRSVMHK